MYSLTSQGAHLRLPPFTQRQKCAVLPMPVVDKPTSAVLLFLRVGLSARGFPRRSLARPGVRVPVKGRECTQPRSLSCLNSVLLCTESDQRASEECIRASGGFRIADLSPSVTALRTKAWTMELILTYFYSLDRTHIQFWGRFRV